jgi:hypothetical protein
VAKKDYQLLEETFGLESGVVPKRTTLRIRLQGIALDNQGMLERAGKRWVLWIPDRGEYTEDNLEAMRSVMRDLWPHAFADFLDAHSEAC